MVTWFEYIKDPNLKQQELKKLNIACGPSPFPFRGWQNYDHENFDSYIEWIKNRTEPCYMKYLQDLVDYAKSGGELKINVRDFEGWIPNV